MFNEQTQPVIEFYSSLGKVQKIDANREISAITADAEAFLDSIGVFPQPAWFHLFNSFGILLDSEYKYQVVSWESQVPLDLKLPLKI